MTQSPQEQNRDPRRIHNADQAWAEANEHLNKIIEYLHGEESDIYRIAGGNTDPSVLYDYMKGYIKVAENNGGRVAHDVTVLMCAAAITRLVRAPRTNDVLAQFDKEIEEHDDH